ncbi:MAG: hypothetical protein QXO70_02640 [Candidatus Pacearchaeota archaeon]
MKEQERNFTQGNINLATAKVEVQENRAVVNQKYTIDNNNTTNISTIKYSEFLKELSNQLKLNIKNVHEAIINSKVNINQYLHAFFNEKCY